MCKTKACGGGQDSTTIFINTGWHTETCNGHAQAGLLLSGQLLPNPPFLVSKITEAEWKGIVLIFREDFWELNTCFFHFPFCPIGSTCFIVMTQAMEMYCVSSCVLSLLWGSSVLQVPLPGFVQDAYIMFIVHWLHLFRLQDIHWFNNDPKNICCFSRHAFNLCPIFWGLVKWGIPV